MTSHIAYILISHTYSYRIHTHIHIHIISYKKYTYII